MKEYMEELRKQYAEYLSGLGIGTLRLLGREVGVGQSTAMKKEFLIQNICAVLTGELQPVERSKRGAPVKDDFVDPKIFDALNLIKRNVTAEFPQKSEDTGIPKPTEKNVLIVRSSDGEALLGEELFKGQFAAGKNGGNLLPLDGSFSDRLAIPLGIAEKYNLRDGDVTVCRARKKDGEWLAVKILSVNDLAVTESGLKRREFDGAEVCRPHEKIRFAEGDYSKSLKWVDWLTPIGKGQRAILLSVPKAGKSTLLKTMAESAALDSNLQVLVLLIDQSPETAAEYTRFLPKENLICTTYGDDPETHVAAARFLLNRAKRLSEVGRDTVLFVDSLSSLASAFNETEEAEGGKRLACGLEGKTVHFIRKFLGSARCFADGGSLTVLGTVNEGTGNPADDILSGNLSAEANSKIVLSDELARKRRFPAFDTERSFTEWSEELFSASEANTERAVRTEYLSEHGNTEFMLLFEQMKTVEELYKKLQNL